MSEARHSRLKRYFDVYDTDKDGQIGRDDFELQAQRRIDALRLGQRSSAAGAVRHVYGSFWEGLRSLCDLDASGAVDVNEWIRVWDDVARSASSFDDLPPWFRAMFDSLCRALFRGAQEMSLADLASFLKAVGRADLTDAAEKELFGDKQTISRTELEALWFRYLCGDDEHVPNVIFA